MANAARGHTLREVAGLLRVGTDKVLAWIKRGELAAVNVAANRSARRRYVVLPGAIEAFAASRRACAPPPPKRRKQPAEVDYYP